MNARPAGIGRARTKILIVAPAFPSDEAPLAVSYVHEQAQVLSQAYDVAVLAPSLTGWRRIRRPRPGGMPEREDRDGIPVFRPRALSRLPRMRILGYRTLLAAAHRGFEVIRRTWGTPEILHAHFVLPSGWWAVRLGRQHAIPVVLTEHSSPFSIHLRTALGRRMVGQTLAGCDRVVAVSPAMADQIREFRPELPIDIVGNVVLTNLFVPPSDAGACRPCRRFLTVATLTEQKGVSFLLEAIRLLVDRDVTAFEVCIGGDGPDATELRRTAHVLGIDRWCRFLGQLGRTEVAEWMRRADAVVVPSLHETFAIPLVEAMASGKPVIATRCGGPEFVVPDHAGVLVEPGNPEALANAMAGFMAGTFRANPEALRLAALERFGETAFLREISAVYARVLRGSGIGRSGE